MQISPSIPSHTRRQDRTVNFKYIADDAAFVVVTVADETAKIAYETNAPVNLAACEGI